MSPQSPQGLPSLGDPIGLAEQAKAFAGRLAISELTRLRELLADDSGEAQYRIEFMLDASGSPRATGEVSTTLALVCQRCLEPLDCPVARRWDLGLIEDAGEERLWGEDEDLYLVADDEMRLSDLVEDELILAVPLVPRHPDGTCQAPAQYKRQQPAGSENVYPFASLGKLKKKFQE